MYIPSIYVDQFSKDKTHNNFIK